MRPPLTIRPIEPGDKPALAAAVGRLSAESRRRRFLAAKPGLSRAELRYLTEVDGDRHLALVAVEGDTIVGVARCVREAPGSEAAEFAIAVGDDCQRKGVGTALATALAEAACRVGIRRFTATTLADNDAVQALMDTFAARLEQGAAANGVRELVAELPGCDAA